MPSTAASLLELQADGRITNVELARAAPAFPPRPACAASAGWRRPGIIRGYQADTDPQKLGWEITFFAIVGLESQKESLVLSRLRATGGRVARGARVPA